jgi:hypothetical protein
MARSCLSEGYTEDEQSANGEHEREPRRPRNKGAHYQRANSPTETGCARESCCSCRFVSHGPAELGRCETARPCEVQFSLCASEPCSQVRVLGDEDGEDSGDQRHDPDPVREVDGDPISTVQHGGCAEHQRVEDPVRKAQGNRQEPAPPSSHRSACPRNALDHSGSDDDLVDAMDRRARLLDRGDKVVDVNVIPLYSDLHPDRFYVNVPLP